MTASPRPDDPETPARYLVGIDLGTTNAALAFVDTAAAKWAVRDFPIPQLTDAGRVEPRPALPSFLYLAAAGEFPPGALRLPWSAGDPREAVGVFARDHGAAVPGRGVASAKSWLSHSGVDRTAPLLPWHGAGDVEKLSPVAASARYLAHLRAAWDHAHPDHPLGGQDVVLTVPASFDEVARELTVQAARDAGLVRVVLVEEPQAAFYAWIDAQGAKWDKRVKAGQTILVCDVGGGTSDFTLIRVRPAAKGKVLFHRVAVGEHLILGGDNLDLALARHVESKLAAGPLPPGRWGALVRLCRQAKETLLGPNSPERLTVSVPGAGSKLIGGAVRVELTREEVERVLVDGFLPRVPLDAKPAARRSGFQEFGLPYAPDPAITRYLAAFLTAHRHANTPVAQAFLPVVGQTFLTVNPPPPGILALPDSPQTGDAGVAPTKDRATPASPLPADHVPGRPDLVLFNGGLFESPVLRQRMLDVLASWFGGAAGTAPTGEASRAAGRQPEVLRNDRLDLAVARGAAYYGMVRRGKGVRITGGLAHSYYVGVQAGAGNEVVAVCLLPAGVEEGQGVDLTDRPFDLLIRRPAEFPLYYSATRTTDKPGQLLPIDPEQLTPLPPIRTVLQSGRKGDADVVSVHLHARLTEIGTLELWCGEAKGDRRWRLEFDVRAAARADAARHEGAAEAEGVVEEHVLSECRNLIRAAFRKTAAGPGDPPAGVVKRLEAATGATRHDWPSSLLRGLWETLMEVEAGRRLGVEHEARWLGLAGFCLRPGYGLAADDWRVGQLWRLYPAGVVFPKNELCRAEWWVLWRRVAGGLSPGQQATLADPLIADWRTWVRKNGSGVKGRSPAFQFGPHESAEVWRLLGSLEHLKPVAKAELGDLLLDRLAREKVAAVRDAILFALGRVGARVPVYGPLNALVEPPAAEAWAVRLMGTNPPDEKAAFAVVQLARRTGDRYRDVSDDTRRAALHWLAVRGAGEHHLELVREGGRLRDEEQRTVFGESLPRGLRIE